MSQTQNDVKFLHFRDISESGEVNPRGGVTIAFRAFGPSEDVQLVDFAASRCSKDDNFSREEGRHIAEFRLQSGNGAGQAGVHTEKELADLLSTYLQGQYGYTRKFSRKRRNR